MLSSICDRSEGKIKSRWWSVHKFGDPWRIRMHSFENSPTVLRIILTAFDWNFHRVTSLVTSPCISSSKQERKILEVILLINLHNDLRAIQKIWFETFSRFLFPWLCLCFDAVLKVIALIRSTFFMDVISSISTYSTGNWLCNDLIENIFTFGCIAKIEKFSE